MPNIDDLSISVKSNVTSATNSIDKLITKLGALSASLGQVNTSGFTQLANGVRQVSNAVQTLSGTRTGNLTRTVNEINKFATINASQLSQVGTAVYNLSYGLNTISNINANTNGINALAISIRKFGSTTATQAAANIPRITQTLQTLVYSMANLGNVQINTQGLANLISAISRLGGARVGTAITQIPQVTQALYQLMATMWQLGNVQINTAGLTQLATAISRLGGTTAARAIQNIPQLTNALIQMINTLSRVPQVNYNTIQLVNALANLASNGARVNTVFRALNNGFGNFGRGCHNARHQARTLAQAIGHLYANYWMLFRVFRLIGRGINLASDLTEVENVVNASFGRIKSQEITIDYKINGEDYITSMDKFAENSIQDFGMSELTSKQVASRFQAMGSAMGFAQDEMAQMSLTLTALTADMASFYNVEQTAVAEDLEAIITGMTRPLRTYGIDLTQTTLQEWALSQGMEANIATMTQAEKVLLRYNYVLAQTGMAQGDFQRTQGTWANQIRILRQQFEALGAIIGQNFIYALKPVVTALNTVMAKLIQFARVVSNSLGKIFGWKYEDTTGGIADDLEFGAEAADDLGSGLGGAADKAKKLKQQLQGFDELNVLTTNEPSSGGGGGGGSLSDEIATGNTGQWVKDNGLFDFESDLDSLYKLGDYIGTTLTNQLRSIDWQSVYQGAKDFGSGLASFLNGLISVDLFSATGATIAGALNTAIYSSLAFGETFDFEEFGLSIATGINTFFTDFDYKSLAKTFNVWANGIVDGLIIAFDSVNWDLIGIAIGDFLKEIDIVGLAGKLLKLAGKILKSLGSAITSSFETAPLETAIVTLFAGLKLVGVGTALSGALSTALSGGLTLSIPKIVATVAMLSIIASKADTRFGDDGGSNILDTLGISGAGFGVAKILGASNPLATAIATTLGTGKAGFEVGLNLGEILAIESGDWELADYYADFKWSDLFDYSIDEYGDAIKGITKSGVDKIAQPIIDLSKSYSGTGKTIKQFSKDISKYFGSSSKVVDLFAKDYSKDMKSVSSTTETLKNNITSKYNTIKGNAENAFNFVKNHILGTTDETTEGMANSYNQAAQSIKISSSDTTSDIVAKYKAMRESVASSTTSMKDSVNANSNSIKITSSDTTSDIVAKYKAMRESNVTEVNTLKSRAVTALSAINTEGGKETDSLAKKILNQFQNAKDGSNKSFTEMQKSVVNNMNKSKSHITSQNWYGIGANLVAGLGNGISEKWNNTSSSGLVGKIVSLASGLTAALKKAFGIRSPSRLWRDDIGYYLAEGLRLGVVGEEGHIAKDIIAMGSRLTDNFSSSLTLATPSSLSSGYNFGVTSTMAHQFSADMSMSSNIADGVRQGLANSQAEQNALLREQNELLMQILEKTGISSSDLFNAVRRESRQHYNQTGTSAFVY